LSDFFVNFNKNISTISACDACLILDNLSTSTFNANSNFGIYKFLHEHQDPYCIRFEGWFVMSLWILAMDLCLNVRLHLKHFHDSVIVIQS